MGYTNAPVEFQRDVDHALQEDNGHLARAFFDDVGIKGPTSRFSDQPISGNPDIRQFVYHYATTLDKILARMIAAGITASGLKAHLAVSRLKIVGSVVSLDGWHLDKGLVSKVTKWAPCESVGEVRGFLGTAGCGRKWIAHFAIKARTSHSPLTTLGSP
ncbi:hypothetical protein BJ165DRAFT_1337340 [Panaeolus papilionaceus]|nr:hypothetical protein BJ165DRAFT_1337340 [Panaeolus papilionaceus]